MQTETAKIDDLDRPIWGAENFAPIIGRTLQQTYYLLGRGKLMRPRSIASTSARRAGCSIRSASRRDAPCAKRRKACRRRRQTFRDCVQRCSRTVPEITPTATAIKFVAPSASTAVSKSAPANGQAESGFSARTSVGTPHVATEISPRSRTLGVTAKLSHEMRLKHQLF